MNYGECIADMRRANQRVDDATGPDDYNVALIALALITRTFLRRFPAVDGCGEEVGASPTETKPASPQAAQEPK